MDTVKPADKDQPQRWNDAVVLMEGPIRLNRELMDRILRLLKQTDTRE